MRPAHPVRHLLRAKDLADARYREPLDVEALARAAHLSQAHFSREFRRAFGEAPHHYLLTRRLERAAALLRNTDRTVADICLLVGLRSVGSFTTSFGRAYGVTPTAYRAAHTPAVERVRIPSCVRSAPGGALRSFRRQTRQRAELEVLRVLLVLRREELVRLPLWPPFRLVDFCDV